MGCQVIIAITPQFDLVEKEEQNEENIVKLPENPSKPAMSENQNSCPENTSESEGTTEEELKEKGNQLLEGTKNEEDQTDVDVDKTKYNYISANKSEKQIEADDDDQDGFKTPTSSEHRIPEITECPPAPRKLRPSKWKRRRSPPPENRRCLEFDAWEEVESLFRPVSDIDDEGINAEEPKNKKVRRDDDDDN